MISNRQFVINWILVVGFCYIVASDTQYGVTDCTLPRVTREICNEMRDLQQQYQAINQKQVPGQIPIQNQETALQQAIIKTNAAFAGRYTLELKANKILCATPLGETYRSPLSERILFFDWRTVSCPRVTLDLNDPNAELMF